MKVAAARWLLAGVATLLGACASIDAPGVPPGTDATITACARWFEQLDVSVEQAGVRDAQAERIAGFAGLRIDRIGAAQRERAGADSAAFEAWLARLQQLDDAGLAVEIANLPHTAFPLAAVADPAAARARSSSCTAAWGAPLRADAALRARLLARAEVPDRYAAWQRAAGLYPLVRWPFFAGVQRWQQRQRALIEHWSMAPPPTQRYVPAGAAPSAAAVAGLWRERPRDALGLPRFTPDELATLLAAHAPALEVETRAGFDRYGALEWRAGRVPAVDADTPVLYQRVTATRYRGVWLLQLVYSLWFPERPAQDHFDLLAGALDAVVLRITLAPDDGRPLLVDTIHGCGCYPLYFPTPDATLRANAPAGDEWAYAPARLPALRPGERVTVRLASATHYVVGVARDEGAPGRPYALRDEDTLRTLPTPQGTTRSVFGPDGLVAGSERAERFFFWPMGIASAGAMRQWGHHATAFVGRSHFDDADLIERRFVIPSLDRQDAANAPGT